MTRCVATILRDLCKELGFRIYLSLLEKHYGGTVNPDEGDYYDSDASIMSNDITVDELTLKHVVTLDGELYYRNLPITEFDIVQKEPFDQFYNKKDYSGPTGNGSVTLDYWSVFQ